MNCRTLIMAMIGMVFLFSGGCENPDLANSKKEVEAVSKEGSLKEKIMKINSIIGKAEMENDKETIIKYLTDDVIISPGFGPTVKGIAGVKNSHAENKKYNLVYRSFNVEPEEIWECSEFVYDRGTFGMSFTYKDHPKPRAYYGSYFTVWHKENDGSLKIKYLTWNLDYDPCN